MVGAGWLAGWTDGQMLGWMGRSKGEWVGGQVGGWTGGWMDEWNRSHLEGNRLISCHLKGVYPLVRLCVCDPLYSGHARARRVEGR